MIFGLTYVAFAAAVVGGVFIGHGAVRLCKKKSGAMYIAFGWGIQLIGAYLGKESIPPIDMNIVAGSIFVLMAVSLLLAMKNILQHRKRGVYYMVLGWAFAYGALALEPIQKALSA